MFFHHMLGSLTDCDLKKRNHVYQTVMIRHSTSVKLLVIRCSALIAFVNNGPRSAKYSLCYTEWPVPKTAPLVDQRSYTLDYNFLVSLVELH